MQEKTLNLTDRQTEYNYGIALLRMLMCFEVILCHCWTWEDNSKILRPFNILASYAVPVFTFMSFFFTQRNFIKKDKDYAINRLWKLILPQIVWAVVYYVIYFVVGIILNIKIVNGIGDLFWQIFTGHSRAINSAMWFQTNLIVITILFFAIFYFFNEQAGFVIIVMLSCASLFLQYSGINHQLFGTLRFELSYPLGRLAEMIPLATFGFIVSKFGLITLHKKNYPINLFITAILSVIFIALDHKVFVVSSGFGYAGIWKLFVGYSLTSFAYNCNFRKVVEKYPVFSRFITKHTLGIYCIHKLINALAVLFLGIQGHFYQCILIYIVGFAISEIISKIPCRWISYLV